MNAKLDYIAVRTTRIPLSEPSPQELKTIRTTGTSSRLRRARRSYVVIGESAESYQVSVKSEYYNSGSVTTKERVKARHILVPSKQASLKHQCKTKAETF